MAQVGLLLGAAKTGTAIGLSLVIFVAGLFLESAGSFGLFLGDTLLLGLLEGSSGGIGLCFGFGGLLGLFALYFGVFGGVPRVENLWYDARLVTSLADANFEDNKKGVERQVWWHRVCNRLTSSSSSSSSNWRRPRAALVGGEEGGVLESLSSSSGVKSGQPNLLPGMNIMQQTTSPRFPCMSPTNARRLLDAILG